MAMKQKKTIKGNPDKFHTIMEYVWIIIAIISLITWIFNGVKEGFKNNLMLLVISVISFFMFLLRRYIRKQKAFHSNSNKIHSNP